MSNENQAKGIESVDKDLIKVLMTTEEFNVW